MPGSRDVDPADLPVRIAALPGIDLVRGLAERAPAYLVGGAVRDLLLGRERADLDVVIEGDVAALADVAGLVPGGEGQFLTGKLRVNDAEIDVAQARAETYPEPGALPEVRPASISDDLARRDFTVNAIAFPLGSDSELIDPHG